MPQNVIVLAVTFAIIVIVLLSIFLKLVPVGLWITAVSAGVEGVNLTSLVGMRLRKVPQDRIILPLIAANKGGIPTSLIELETHHLMGGNVNSVVKALVFAHRTGTPLNFQQAATIDLAGKNVLEAVQMSVNPKVIDTPRVTAVSRNGGEISAFARLTVRMDALRILNSDGEEMLVTRARQAMLACLISSTTQWEIKENPAIIAIAIRDANCDRGNALEIVHIEAFTV